MEKVRVRFAPSPTGALHIGGVRTALYNYLLARKTGGTLILRIEDTDQTRFVPGAEAYIREALKWCGIELDEGPEVGGAHGPYRQSERKARYGQYAQQLIDSGNAYYAFDSAEELDEMRSEYESRKATFRYDGHTRMQLKNSLTLSPEEVQQRLDSDAPYTIRLKVPRDESVLINDLIRGEVTFQTNELDDKIMLKSDGMPTYHLANIVDDKSMEISHVIRGEEWLPSTAHHVLLYRAFGWEDSMPQFAHLPLILKPTGKGKLGKRDGSKFGFPVFPISWDGDRPEDSFTGFREFGFDPRAVVNFLAFLGWNPGTEQEIFSLEQLCDAFSIERIGKSGARFDFEKAKWFNQQYIIASDNTELAAQVQGQLSEKGQAVELDFLVTFCGLMKERVNFLPEFLEKGYYFFEPVRSYEEKPIRKKWRLERRPVLLELNRQLNALEVYDAASIEKRVKEFMEANELGFGDILPFLRIGLSGTMKGPSVFDMMALLGKEEVESRLLKAFDHFDAVKSAS
ncbi:MAG: glutamate--tRNA ligase [Bacteroidota bacterium]